MRAGIHSSVPEKHTRAAVSEMVAAGKQEGLETDTRPLQSSEIFLLFYLNFLITPDEESQGKRAGDLKMCNMKDTLERLHGWRNSK